MSKYCEMCGETVYVTTLHRVYYSGRYKRWVKLWLFGTIGLALIISLLVCAPVLLNEISRNLIYINDLGFVDALYSSILLIIALVVVLVVIPSFIGFMMVGTIFLFEPPFEFY